MLAAISARIGWVVVILTGLLEDAFESKPASGDAFAGVLQGVGDR